MWPATRFLFVLMSIVMLSACGSAPVIKGSKHYDVDGNKIESFEFVYYKSRMSNARNIGQASPYPESATGLNDIRYETFGNDLVKVASDVFKKYGVELTGSGISKIKLDLSALGGMSDALSINGNDVLYVYASSGKVTSNQHMVRANYVFDAVLLDLVKKKVKWRASVDTSAWAGRDFVMKNVGPTVYDEAYAVQLLTLLAEKMKDDGVMN